MPPSAAKTNFFDWTADLAEALLPYAAAAGGAAATSQTGDPRFAQIGLELALADIRDGRDTAGSSSSSASGTSSAQAAISAAEQAIAAAQGSSSPSSSTRATTAARQLGGRAPGTLKKAKTSGGGWLLGLGLLGLGAVAVVRR